MMKSSNKVRLEYMAMYMVLIVFISTFLGLILFFLVKTDNQRGSRAIGMMAISLMYFYMIYLVTFHFYLPIVKTRKAVRNLKKDLSQINIDYLEIKKDLSIDEEFKQFIEIIKKAANREYLESILRKQAQLDNLQSQINPHFLYNILDSVRGDVLIHGLKDTAGMLEALSNFFRYGIGSSGGLITFEEEYENAQNYMKIQQYRFGNRIIMKSNFDRSDKVIMTTKMPKMTLQPLVENAITHGIESQITEGKIVIRVTYTNRRMLITVEDNGIGMNAETLESINHMLNSSRKVMAKNKSKSNGVALLNVSERIKLLFGNEYGLSINSTEGLGTEVHIAIPIEAGDLV